MENVIECIYNRRSIRKYKKKEIPKEIIEKIIHAGVMAPSARNVQPCRFSVVVGKDRILEIGKRVVEMFHERGRSVSPQRMATEEECIFYNAPCLIVVSGDPEHSYLKDDVNLCVENMFLAAHSLGIGSCWIGRAKVLEEDPEIKDELGIQDLQIVAPLVFGYPDENPATPERKAKILKWIE